MIILIIAFGIMIYYVVLYYSTDTMLYYMMAYFGGPVIRSGPIATPGLHNKIPA